MEQRFAGRRGASSRIAGMLLFATWQILIATARPATEALEARTDLTLGHDRIAGVVRTLHGPTLQARFDLPDKYIELNQTFAPGNVVLSYVIAVVGSLCTLELLLRRTSNRGRSNILLLVFGGICFGSVATFSMHFVGNNALTLHHPLEAEKGYRPLTLAYSAGFTILSLVVSCICMIAAFFVMGLDLHWDRLLPGRRRKDAAYDKDREGSSSLEAEDAADALAMAGEADDKTVGKKANKVAGRHRVDNMLNKLRWALSWSMLEVPAGLGGSDVERRKEEQARADNKAQEIEREQSKAEERKSDEMASSRPLEMEELAMVPARRIPPPLNLSQSRAASAEPTASSAPPLERRGSANSLPWMRSAEDISLSTTFRPGFSFGTINSSAPPVQSAPLFPRNGEASSPGSSRYPPSAIPSHVFPGVGSGRRASLPSSALPGSRELATPSFTLTRIQSHPDSDGELFAPRKTEAEIEAEQAAVVDQVLEETRARQASMAVGDYPMRNALTSPDPGMLKQDATSPSAASDGSANKHESTSTVGLPELNEGGYTRSRNIGKRARRRLERANLARWEKALGWDVVTKEEIFKIFITGIITGWGIAGMHYIGQRSIISIPYIAYSAGAVVGSVVIACSAVVVALYIMFIILRPKLKHSWPVKLGVALVLGAAVCLMHYCAMAGTHYGLVRGIAPPPSAREALASKNIITGLVSGLAFCACLVIGTFLVLDHVRRIRNRRGRRRVVVATMIYDEEDRLLVGTDGVLPMTDIVATDDAIIKMKPSRLRRSRLSRQASHGTWDTSSTSSSVLHVDLSPSHPAFIAALRSTWAWRQPGVLPPTSAAQASAARSSTPQADWKAGHETSGTDADRRSSAISATESAAYPAGTDGLSAPMSQNVSRFLDRFNAAVGRLAQVVTGNEQNARRLGVLYDRMLTTGYVSLNTNEMDGKKATISKGQMIFLVRRLASDTEKQQLLARNFLFAEPTAVANVMSKALAVPVDNLLEVLRDQRDFIDYGLQSGLKPGRLYAGVCVIQPTTFDGIQILVGRRRHNLPMREICPLSTSPLALRTTSTDRSVEAGLGTVEEVGEALQGLQGQTLFDLLAPPPATETEKPAPPEDQLVTKLRAALVQALIPTLDMTLTSKAMTKILPRLWITPYLIPVHAPLPDAVLQNKSLAANVAQIESMQTAYMIVFKAVLNVDGDYTALDWENWNLFRAQSECVTREGRGAQNVARLLAANANVVTPTEEQLRTRRPSKVQWNVASPDTSSTAGRSTLFNPEWNLGGADAETHDLTDSRSASPSNSGRFAASAEKAAPRRSSLARAHTPADYEATSLLSEHVRELAPGVASWDPDWLAKLLREDLYPRHELEEEFGEEERGYQVQ